jgi:RNA polymerase sigma factor (sigma-70 family)
MLEIGDRAEAFRRLYRTHYQALSAYARRRLDLHDADDAVAETFLVAWRRLEDVPEGELALPWLYGVARRVVSEDRRSGRRRGRLIGRLSEGTRAADDHLHEATGRIDEQLAVESALSKLRPRDRELLRLAEWEDLSPVELARVFDCSTNAVAIRLHRAHRRFGQALRSVEADVEREPEKEALR